MAMLGRPSIKLDKDLYDQARQFAETAGYASVDEFISHLVRRELERTAAPADESALKQRLKGLGYL